MITMYYDDACTLCFTTAHAMQDKNPSEINIIPVPQAEAILAKANISLVDAMTYVFISDEKGKMHKGMDAVRLLYKTANVPFNFVLSLPIIKQLGDFAYPFIARNRYYFPKWAIKLMYGKLADMSDTNFDCENGVCHIPPSKR